MLDIEEFKKIRSQNVPHEEFCELIMQRLVDATGAQAAVFWNCEQKPYQATFQKTRGRGLKLNIEEQEHGKILDKVLSEQRGLLVKAEKQDGTPNGAPKLMLAPLAAPSRQVIELVVSTETQIESDQDLMKAVELAAQIAGQPDQLQSSSQSKAISIQDFSTFIQKIHGSIERKPTWSNLANEIRLLLDCDRVSIVIKKRGRFRIVAISGQPSVNRRSNSVQLLESLAQGVLKTQTDFWYPTDAEALPQLNEILEIYLVDNATRSLVVKPVFQSVEQLVEDPESNASKHNPVIAGVIFEHCNEQWGQAEMDPVLDFVNVHASSALRNTKTHNDVFLFPLLNLLGKSRVLAAPRVLPKTLLAAGAILLATLFLTLYQVPFYISANGVLVPQNRNWIFAGQNGEVDEIYVQHGDLVQQGSKMLKLESKELQVQVAETRGRIKVLQERKEAIENRNYFGGQATEEQAIEDSIDSIEAEISALQEKIDLLSEQQENTVVCSPINGQVITWDVQQKLAGRTVRADQQLLEIADIEGPWVLELDVEDRRVGLLLNGIQNSNEQKLEVKYTLAAEPNKTFDGILIDVSNSIQFSGENSQIVRAQVQLDHEEIPLKQAKTGVVAKIYCGYETSIGYLWLHDVSDAFNRYVWFYLSR